MERGGLGPGQFTMPDDSDPPRERDRPRCGHLVTMRTSPRPPTAQSIGLVIDDDDRHCPFESLARAARGDAVLVLWSDGLVKNCRPAWIPSGLLRVIATCNNI